MHCDTVYKHRRHDASDFILTVTDVSISDHVDISDECQMHHTLNSDGQKLTKKLTTKSLTKFFLVRPKILEKHG